MVGSGAWADDQTDTNIITHNEFESLRIKAEKGNADAEFNLGKCYHEGMGVKQDKAEALKWTEKAAAQEIPEAQMMVGLSYWLGMDVKMDEAKGVKPVSAHWAAEAVACADVILFSMPGHDLSPETMNWLDLCVQARTKTEGALAVMVTEPHDMDLVVEALLSRLQFAAHRLRMDFLQLLPPDAVARFGQPVNPRLDKAREDPGSSHWGLNE
jgi:hypothetical protein